MPRSPEPARRQILGAALELFARNGISGTSLREIRLAANQRNVGALHYHFQNKEGLIRALLERELPALVERRLALLNDADGLWSVAAVFVLPYAELATGTPHERAVVQFFSELLDDVSYSIDEIDDLVGDTGTREASKRLRDQLPHVPQKVFDERMRVGITMYLHAAAIWARGQRRAHLVSDRLFRKNLVDMFLGAMVAPY